ncbi:MAG: helix-turn-helix protein [Bacteroidota bacterium]|nr:helix-turn-helix protein [Bacteroidota bacterium]
MDPMRTSKEIIGLMIQTKRKEKNLTQQGLGDLLGVDRQYIWRMENGRINLTLDYLDKVIHKLECEQADFILMTVAPGKLNTKTDKGIRN